MKVDKQHLIRTYIRADTIRARDILSKEYGIQVSRQGYRQWLIGGKSDREAEYLTALATAISERLKKEKQAEEAYQKFKALVSA